ncbi:MAG: Transcriptional regulator, AcrR family [uncultured Thermomicrobiales bacterium]|uniref:Transcriptional regulator, AcrR family n=1 Tax=uncultured Thermomicrobiales bacterium TaxID=1645740 RepID=A0A6J4UY42_9BACT|nr:MAG: Transcriptional regulator, AcrR family [uncultured Thermomicrobiales bacterium]
MAHPAQPRPSAATRDRLLAAAERIVARDGAARLTLDAVARETGLSKGGVLYHFASKDALVAGLVERLADAVALEQDAEAAADPRRIGRRTRAFVRATFAPTSQPADPVAVGAALLAALGTNPALLDPLRARYADWQARLEDDGIDPDLAAVVRLAADGLMLAEAFGLAPPAPETRDRLLAALLRLTAPESASR